MSLQSLYNVKYLDTLEQKILHNIYGLFNSNISITLSSETIYSNQAIFTTFSNILLSGKLQTPYTLSLLTDASGKFVVSGLNLQINASIAIGTYPITLRLADALAVNYDFPFTINVTAVPLSNTRSLLFRNVPSYFNIPVVAGNTLTGECTFSTWFKMTTSGTDQVIMENRSVSLTNAVFILDMLPAGTIVLYISQDGTNLKSITSTSSYGDNTWKYLTVTFKANTLKMYINGLLVSSTVTGPAVNSLFTNNAVTKVGIASNSSSFPIINGYLDELAIFNIQLSAAEVLEAYNNQDLATTSRYAFCVGWYRFETAAINNIPDETGTSNVTSTTGILNSDFNADVPP